MQLKGAFRLYIKYKFSIEPHFDVEQPLVYIPSFLEAIAQ